MSGAAALLGKCCCASCGAGDLAVGIFCSFCTEYSTFMPNQVELLFSGVSTFAVVSGFNCFDLRGATVSGAFVLTAVSACKWQRQEIPSATYNYHRTGNGTAGGATCAGGTVQEDNYGNLLWEVFIHTVSGTTYVDVSLGDLFYGRAVFVDCHTPMTVNNGTLAPPIGARLMSTTGSVTVTFCP